MNSKDLRIGNYVDVLGNIDQIQSIGSNERGEYATFKKTYNGYYLTHNNEQLIKPINLTEEWVVKFGFIYNKEWDIFHISEYNIDNISLQKESNIVFRIINDSINCFQFYLDTMSIPQYQPRLIFVKNIKYLHQFQNIFYSLSDIELTIK